MKKRVLIVIFIGVYSLLTAQNEKSVSVYSTRGNVLYIGINNPIVINAYGVKKDIINVKITNGMIFRTTNAYKAIVNKVGSAEIVITEYGKVIGKRKFECYNIPVPYPTVGSNPENCRGGDISFKNLVALSGVKATQNLGLDIKYEITSFILIAYINGVPVSENSTSDKFTQKQIELMRKTKKGHRIIIDNIKAKGLDDKVIRLSPLVFKIK